VGYPWYSQLILIVAVTMLASAPSASSWRFPGEWSPSTAALVAIGLMLLVLVDFAAQILAEVRGLKQREPAR